MHAFFLNCGGYVEKKQTQPTEKQLIGFVFCDLARIQTWNLLSRNQVLYSVELRGLLQMFQ